MPITVRPLQAADLPAVGRLFDQYRQFYKQPPDLTLACRFIAERFERGESVVLVAHQVDQHHVDHLMNHQVAQQASGELVGFCQMYPSFCSVEAAPIYTLYDLYVSPQARGLGAGRRLLVAAEARAAADGKVRMDLTTARTNFNAQSLYDALGWVRDDVFLAYSRRVLTHPDL